MAAPKSEQEAIRRLKNADPETREGLDEINEVFDWIKERDSISERLADEAASTRGRLTTARIRSRDADTRESMARVESVVVPIAEAIVGGVRSIRDWIGENYYTPSSGSPPGPEVRPASATETDRSIGRTTDRGNQAWAARYAGQAEAGPQSEVEGGVNLAARLPQDILGGPENFGSPSGGIIGPGGQAGTRFMPGRTVAYYKGDETEILKSRPAEERRRIQELLIVTGLASSVIPGEVDPNTRTGFAKLLEISNTNGEDWGVTVDRLQRAVARGELDEEGSGRAERAGYVAPPPLQPDPARLRVSVRNMAQDTLGRDLDEDEIDYLTAALEDVEQDNYSRLVAADRAQFDANEAAVTTGEDQTTAPVTEYGDAVVASRFRELFEERYAPEIDMRGKVEIGRSVSQLIGRGAGTVAGMTGGR